MSENKDLTFRELRADEIQVRVAMAKPNGVSLLLYKDARCDMKILNETVGKQNWQRKHYECKGNLFCSVGIKCGDEWIWKDDCGTEGNYEKEKSESSDSFKRACFSWSIGLALYSSPFIWVKSDDCNITTDHNGKPTCNDHFIVKHIAYENGVITQLCIYDEKTKKDCFKFGYARAQSAPKGQLKKDVERLTQLAESKGVAIEKLCHKYKVTSLVELSDVDYEACYNGLAAM
uniref:hypothetical protein n=1 Tax=Eubacterium sp. TaxID=142586 RepID=UPI003FEDDF39